MRKPYDDSQQPVFNAGLGTVMRLHDILTELNRLYALTGNGLQNLNDITNLNNYFSLIEALYAEGLNEIDKEKRKVIKDDLNTIHHINNLSIVERTQKGTKIKLNLKDFWLKRKKCRLVENYIRESLAHILNPKRESGDFDIFEDARTIPKKQKFGFGT